MPLNAFFFPNRARALISLPRSNKITRSLGSEKEGGGGEMVLEGHTL